MTQVLYKPDQDGGRGMLHQHPLSRRPSVRVTLGVGAVASSIVVLAGVSGPLFGPQSNTVEATPVAPAVTSAIPAPPTPAGAPPAPVNATPATNTDSRGFVNSYARCDGAQTAVVVGRTEKSLVAICTVDRGRFVYKGVRLSRGLSVSIDGVTANAGGFVARNFGMIYTVSPTELVITSDNSVVAREAMLQFEDRRAPAPRIAPTPQQAPAPAARPPRPPAEYPLLPLTQQGTGDGAVKFTPTGPWQFSYAVQCPSDSAVLGSIDARGPKGARYYSEQLSGDSSSYRDGTSRRLTSTGPTVLEIQPYDQTCGWTISIQR